MPSVLPIRTERLILRRFVPDDVAAVLRLSADPTVFAVADELGQNEAEARAYLEGQATLEEFGLGTLFDLAVTLAEGDELIGMATVVRAETSTEIGYALHSDSRGRGYATEVALALVGLAFEELGASEVQAQVGSENAASRAVLERAGLPEAAPGRIAVREAGNLAYVLERSAWAATDG